MENEEMKQPISVELNDDALEQASGGTNVGDRKEMSCTRCGKTVHEYNEARKWYCTICGQVYGQVYGQVCAQNKRFTP